jgi:DNA-binding NarL/FixJ family response regulator
MDMRLPGSVQEIADVIGRERALFLVGKLPRYSQQGSARGDRIQQERVLLYIPKKLTSDHPLVSILGLVDAGKMVRMFGGEILKATPCTTIYREFRDRSIARMASEGMKHAEIAELMQMSLRHVKNVVRENQQVERSTLH